AMALTFTGSAAAETGNEWPLTNFAWGAGVSSSIDMTGQDLSAFNIAAQAGYKNRAIQMLGAGVGIDMAVGNNSRMYPAYAIIRTSFVPGDMRCFFEARAGYSFNSMAAGGRQSGIYGATSLGVNLAMGKNFRSHIVIGYTYRQLRDSYHDMSAVTAGIGINF
ncbi:MAG: hypothetical protein K2K99_05470, partial [Muribaculaceae bacterium]|nr:hypothetical protein [Muribaculaceae bacterium]